MRSRITCATSLASRQRGAALFTALIILVALTIISLASLGTSLLELRMSGNVESTMRAQQSAQAAVDNVIDSPMQNFKVTGNKGYTNCTTNLTVCNENTVTLATGIFDTANRVKVTRETAEGPVPGFSAQQFRGATFSVESTFDRSSLGQGKSTLTQGYVRIYPCVGQCDDPPPPSEHN